MPVTAAAPTEQGLSSASAAQLRATHGDNAIRETPPGQALSVLVVPGAQHVRLIVRDSGPGISASQREHLFEPFHTGHPNTGSGLGLAICREICQSLGASIELVNRTEQGRASGLDAIVVFPAAPAPAVLERIHRVTVAERVCRFMRSVATATSSTLMAASSFPRRRNSCGTRTSTRPAFQARTANLSSTSA